MFHNNFDEENKSGERSPNEDGEVESTQRQQCGMACRKTVLRVPASIAATPSVSPIEMNSSFHLL